MVRCSYNIVGILNLLSLLLSFPIIGSGIWLSKQADTECERFLDKPVIVLGVCILLLSFVGLLGYCCRVTCLLWVYLLVIFLLLFLLAGFTIFVFVETNKGGGKAVGNYSKWLQDRVNDHWPKIRSCLVDSKICEKLRDEELTPALYFGKKHLYALESGCCKPPESCNFENVNPRSWTKNNTTSLSNNPDCGTWDNDPNTLCYGCQSCKAGLLDNIKTDWKKVAGLNAILVNTLIIFYSIGSCAFRNIPEDNSWKRYP